jgi:hypothetical protein
MISLMRLFFFSIFLFIFLTGCPHRPVFTVIPNPVSKVDSFKITPLDLFYHVNKGIVECSIVYKIKNETDSIQEFNFSASQLIGSDTIIKVSDIVYMGNIPAPGKIKIYPALDTLIGLDFIGNKNHFGDTIKVILASPGLIYRNYFYKRVRNK